MPPPVRGERRRSAADDAFLAWVNDSDPSRAPGGLDPSTLPAYVPDAGAMSRAMEAEARAAESEGDMTGAAALRGAPAGLDPRTLPAVPSSAGAGSGALAAESAAAASEGDMAGANALRNAAAEDALWARASSIPALGSGGSIDLPGAPLTSRGPMGGFPTPGADHPLGAFFGLGGTPRVVEPAGPVAASARRGGGRRPAPAPTPPTEADINAAFLGEMTGRPLDSRIAPEDMRGESALDRDRRLASEMGRLETRRAEVAGMAAADEIDRVAGETAARAELEAERQQAMGTARQRYQSAVDRAASLTLDPDGYYHSRGMGGTLAASIAVGLGALASGINGGPNVAAQMIEAEIDRDLRAQEQQIDSAFRRADAQGGIVEMMASEFGSREAALNASRALAFEDAAARVAEEEARLGASESRLQAEALRNQLTDGAAAARDAAERAEAEWAMNMALQEAQLRIRNARATREERRAMPGAGGGVEFEEPTEARLTAANRLIDTGVDPVEAARAVGIDPSLMRGSRFAEATTADSAGNVAALSSTLDEIESLIPSRESGGDAPGVGVTGFTPEWLLTDEGRQMRESLLNAVDLLGRLRSGAAISAGEEDRFRRILEGAGTDESLRRGIGRIRSEIDARTRRTRTGTTLDEAENAALEGLGARAVVD